MTSVLYRGEVVHVRHDEHAHRFRYPVYVAGLDLDELEALPARVRLFSLDRPNLFSLYRRDHACAQGASASGVDEVGRNGGARALREGHAAVLAAHGLPRPARVELVTWLRTAHYLFNPVSFFVGRDAAGRIESVLAEVRNNYGGRHSYVLGPAERLPDRRGKVGFRVEKLFFVSPFIHGPATYDFWFSEGERLDIHMDVRRPTGEPLLTAHLRGAPSPLTDRALAVAAVRYPLMSLQVIALIYGEALAAHLRGVPYRRPGPDHAVTEPPPPPPPRASLARRLVLRELTRRPLRAGRLDVRLPDRTSVVLGDGATADATITVRAERAFSRIALRGELGAGEAYVDGDWDADDLPRALRLFLQATAARGVESPLTRLAAAPAVLRHRLGRRNHRAGSARNVVAHYDLGNAFYRLFLDEEMVYSCARWRGAATLEDAQRAKLAHLCDLAALSPGERVLELGCGWGALACTAAARGTDVTAVTVSPAQLAYAQARAGADRVAFACRDYRDVGGTFDAILSCEMLEAVGARYLPAYFATVAARLRPGGRAVIQTITMPDERYASYLRSVDWMQTYVFPGSHIPSIGAIDRAATAAGLRIARADDVGLDYVPTLATWRRRFHAAAGEVRALGFDDAFVRTWDLYLAFSEAAFAERTLAVHQLVLQR